MGKFAPTNMENLYRVAVNGPAKTRIPHTLHSRYMRSNNVDNNDNNNNNCVRDGIFSSRAELAQSPLYAVIRMSVRTEFTFFAHPNAVIDGQITFLTFVQFGSGGATLFFVHLADRTRYGVAWPIIEMTHSA